MADKNDTPAVVVTTKVERYTKHGVDHLTTRLAKDGQPFTYIDDEKNQLAHPLRGKWLKKWLRKAAQAKGETLRNDEINEICENLYANADIEEETLDVFLRVGRNSKGDIELANRSTGQTLRFNALTIHMIAAHGFYQGRGSRYRIEPSDIQRLLK